MISLVKQGKLTVVLASADKLRCLRLVYPHQLMDKQLFFGRFDRPALRTFKTPISISIFFNFREEVST
jgi:hypothetical protein